MRDSYGRITPDFEAWEKLGYKFAEIHEQTYTLCSDPDSYYDFVNIVCEYDVMPDEKPIYTKERFTFPDSKLEEFTAEEKAQIEKDIKNWEDEIEEEREYQAHVDQAIHDELYEPTYDPETGAM